MIDLIALQSGAKLFGLELNETQLVQFEQYASLLYETNKVMNLTRVPVEEFIYKHILDSLSLFTLISPTTNLKLLDVGTGAGFPGVPLKIVNPHLQLTLSDSKNKALDFLKKLCDELKLSDVNFVWGRAEDMGRSTEHRETYDIVTARALAAMPVLVELLLPFVKVRGLCAVMKSNNNEEEILNSQKAVYLLGGGELSLNRVHIPNTDIERLLVTCKKIKLSPHKFPRDWKDIKQSHH